MPEKKSERPEGLKEEKSFQEESQETVQSIRELLQ